MMKNNIDTKIDEMETKMTVNSQIKKWSIEKHVTEKSIDDPTRWEYLNSKNINVKMNIITDSN